MTEQEIHDLYTELMYTGRNTLEKHIRHAAEQLVEDMGGGFKVAHVQRVTIPWRIRRGFEDVSLWVPHGMHGFALQMVIEAQLRDALA